MTEHLNALSNQLEAALELSTSLQAQRTTAQSTISALESKVNALETLVQTTQQAPPALQCHVVYHIFQGRERTKVSNFKI